MESLDLQDVLSEAEADEFVRLLALLLKVHGRQFSPTGHRTEIALGQSKADAGARLDQIDRDAAKVALARGDRVRYRTGRGVAGTIRKMEGSA